MAKETNEILGHGADADGIEEYDNPLPDWWVGLFVLTTIGGVAYGVNYHFIAQTSQEAQYVAEMTAAEQRWPTPEGPTTLVMDDATIAEGKGIFAQSCASCHNADLSGGIGPNLTDAEWIHGGEPDQVLATITDGVAAKGMPAWGAILGPKKVAAVASFVVSKKGSAPSKAPAPEVEQPPTDGVAAEGSGTPDVDGAEIYKTNCSACHGLDMKGLVGPSLIDSEWIHGGELEQIKLTITNGVPEKGMTSWGPILGDEKIDLVARFVHMKSTGAL